MSDGHDEGCLQLKDIVLDLATGFPVSMRTINIRTGTESITGQRARSDQRPKIWPRERVDPCQRSCIGQDEVQKEKRAGGRPCVQVRLVEEIFSWSADDSTCLVNGSREQAGRESISA